MGIPAMLIATDRFRSVLEATSKIAGVEEARWSEVSHPIGSLGAEELRERAKEAVDHFVDIVVRMPPGY
jgi:hypothetical protein